MSELAPFVATVLRDKVVEDLKAENENLRQENDGLRHFLNRGFMTIQGGDGSRPIYAYGHIDPNIQYNNPTSWPGRPIGGVLSRPVLIDLRQNGTFCPVPEFANVEIHLQGEVFRLDEAIFFELGPVGANGFVHVLCGYRFEGRVAPNIDMMLTMSLGPVPYERFPELRPALNLLEPGNIARFRNDEIEKFRFGKVTITYNPPIQLAAEE